MAKILRKCVFVCGQQSTFVGQKSILRYCSIQIVKDDFDFELQD